MALWIHTFVPGLPLSYLGHNIVAGNSLTGIGSINEAVLALDPRVDPDQPTIWREAIVAWIGRSSDALVRLARSTDATTAEIREARQDHQAAISAIEPAAALMDVLVAARLGEAVPPVLPDDRELVEDPRRDHVRAVARGLEALHFPVVFPEVFLRDRPGFDCVVGNPPWDKVMFEAQQFWVTRSPGLNALPPARRAAEIERLRRERPTDAEEELTEQAARARLQQYFAVAYRHLGRGHYDYAKLFVERAVSLLAKHGALGYVLPRQCLVLGGWSDLRELLVQGSALSVVQARNRGGWLFDDIHHSYMVVFLSRLGAQTEDGGIGVWHAVTSLDELLTLPPTPDLQLSRGELGELSDSLTVPWFDDSTSADIFRKVRARPRISTPGSWVHATHDARWDFRGSGPHARFARSSPSQDSWRILMTRHVHQFSIDRAMPYQAFVRDPRDLVPLGFGVLDGEPGPGLGPNHPVIVFRHPSRNDDTRTMVAAALEDRGEIHNKGYVHAYRHDPGTTTTSLLALLGYLNTYVCDWWVRRFVDRHVTAPVANNVRLPRWTPDNVEEAADVSAELLRRAGSSVLSGGRRLAPSAGLSSRPEHELRARLEVLAAQGLGVSAGEMEEVLGDFSEGARPPVLEDAIMAGMRHET